MCGRFAKNEIRSGTQNFIIKNIISSFVHHFVEPVQREPLAGGLRVRQARGDARLAPRFSRAAMDLLLGYAWPGNVRELKNVVERAATFCDEGVITPDDLPSEVGGHGDLPGMVPFSPVQHAISSEGKSFHDAKEEMLTRFEKEYLQDLLRRFGSNISRTAREAGVDRRHFYRLLKKHDLKGGDGEAGGG